MGTLYDLRPVQEVVINGVRHRALGGSVTVGTRQATAQAQITLDVGVNDVGPGDQVIYRAGYSSDLRTIFVGEIQTEGVRYYPNTVEISCVGIMNRLGKPLGEPPLDGTEPVDADGNPLPLIRWPKSSTDTTQYTDGAIVKDILTQYGVTDVDIADGGNVLTDPDFIALYRNQTGLQLIQEIDFYTGYRTYDGPDGRVYRSSFSGKPAVGSLVLNEGRDLLDVSRDITLGDVINRVTVQGRQTAILTPRATRQADSLLNPRTGKPYIPNPPKYRATDHQTDILQTEALCDAAAARELGEKNRLQESVSVSLPRGNTGLAPGASCYLISPKMGYDTSMVFFIDEVRHTLGDSSIFTSLTLTGGYASEGTNPNQAPIAAFTIAIDVEKLDDGTQVYLIVCDGSMSYDPDGQYTIPATPADPAKGIPGSPAVTDNGIVLYKWTSTLPNAPTISDGGKRAVFYTTTDPTGKTITLTVYDNQGKTGSVTKTIDPKSNTRVMARDLWAAVEARTYFYDGIKQTWTSVPVAAVGVCEQAADTYNLAWTASGTLSKITINADGTLTAVTVPVGGNVTSAYIAWKAPGTLVDGKKAWAGASNGDVYVSLDSAATWTKVGTVSGGAAVTWLNESPYQEGDVYALAGRALWHSFSSGAAWDKVYEFDNTSAVATGYTSGFDEGFIIFDSTSPPPSGEPSRIQERNQAVQGDWNADPSGQAPASGVYTLGYSYAGDGGETTLSPTANITVNGTQAIKMTALGALPPKATGVNVYMSELAGSSSLRRVASGGAQTDFLITAPPAPGNAPSPTSNTTTLGVTPPSAAPTLSTAPSAAANPVDKPVHPYTITMGVYEKLLYTAGVAADASSQVWKAPFDGDFTFSRKVYDATFGVPRHILRDGQFDTIIYGAADDKLFKTVDGFETTCYPLKSLSADENGKRLGYGRLRGLTTSGAFIASVWVTDTTLANSAIVRLTDKGWEYLAAMPAIWNEATLGSGGIERPLRRIATNVYLIWTRTTSPNSAAFTTMTNAARSTDGGKTWTVISAMVGVIDIVSALDGTCYAICSRPPGPDPTWGCRVYRSTDQGATWLEVFTNPYMTAGSNANQQENYVALAVDPTNSQRVALKSPGGGNGDHAATVTTDGFTTYSVYPLVGDYAWTWHTAGMQGRTAGGEFLYVTSPTSNKARLYRVTFGGMATLIFDGEAAGTPDFQADGRAPAFASYDTLHFLLQSQPHPLLRSTDDGATWSAYYTGGAQNPTGLNLPGVRGAVYDPSTSTLYIGLENIGGPTGYSGPPAPFQALLPGMDPNGKWEDLTPAMYSTLGKYWRAYRGGMQPL